MATSSSYSGEYPHTPGSIVGEKALDSIKIQLRPTYKKDGKWPFAQYFLRDSGSFVQNFLRENFLTGSVSSTSNFL